jgi:hypothetical protein
MSLTAPTYCAVCEDRRPASALEPANLHGNEDVRCIDRDGCERERQRRHDANLEKAHHDRLRAGQLSRTNYY